MFGIDTITDIAKGLLSPVTSMVEGWQKRKTAKVENELKLASAVTDAKIERLKTQQDADIAWEITSIQNSGWKDEYILILWSIPVIMCFIPGLDVYVSRGFDSLEKCPDWFKWAWMVIVGSSYGYRKIADFMGLKKGI